MAANTLGGDDFKTGDANVYDRSASDDNLEKTCAVGLYPHRPSPFGVEDMAGNVWEWCLNKDNNPDQSDDIRVLRGGSWLLSSDLARCASRLRYNPVLRYDDRGFRVVCSSPSTDH